MAVHGEGLQKNTHNDGAEKVPQNVTFYVDKDTPMHINLYMCVYIYIIYTDCQASAKPRAKYKLYVHLVGRR